MGHGLRLATKLNWPLLTGPDVVTDGLPAEELTRIVKFTPAKKFDPWLVATAAGLDQCHRVDVLVRADGGVSALRLPEAVRRARVGRRDGLLVVDFKDGHHPYLRRRADGRVAAYRDAGWSVDGREMTDYDRFCQQRQGARR